MIVLPGVVPVYFQIMMTTFFRTTDGGQSWTDLGELIPEGIDAFAIADPQNLVAADLMGNMFHSSDAGLSWSQVFSHPVCSQVS